MGVIANQKSVAEMEVDEVGCNIVTVPSKVLRHSSDC